MSGLRVTRPSRSLPNPEQPNSVPSFMRRDGRNADPQSADLRARGFNNLIVPRMVAAADRVMQPGDIPECVDLVANHAVVGPRYGPMLEHLPAAWLRLLQCEAKTAFES